jgi:predicted acyltransferase
VQVLVSFLLIGITELIYRNFSIEGFNHPFVPNENFGTWLDMQYGGEDLNGHWVAFNAIPTTAHTIWGVLAGILLKSKKSAIQKLKILLISGVILVIIGYALDPITPIIKRISTSSFVIVSGGWTILALAFSYWLIDIKKYRKWVIFFSIVVMNSLFIYLFSHIGGGILVHEIIKPFSMALFGWTGELSAQIITYSITWFGLWYICYWMYKNKIFIKI